MVVWWASHSVCDALSCCKQCAAYIVRTRLKSPFGDALQTLGQFEAMVGVQDVRPAVAYTGLKRPDAASDDEKEAESSRRSMRPTTPRALSRMLQFIDVLERVSA